MEHSAIQIFTLLLVLAVGAQWLAWRTHLPAIVLLSVVGIVLGPVLGVIEPHAQMGGMLGSLVSLAVAVILFDGGLSLRFEELKETKRAVWRLVGIGGLLSWVLITMAACYIMGLSLPVSILFGGILVVTGPTVIVPLLRQAKLNTRVSSVLKWEGIVIDPIGAMFAVITYTYLTTPVLETSPMASTVDLTVIIVFLVIISFLFGRATAWLVRDDHLPEFLKAPAVLTAVVLSYAISNMMLNEGGLIAVTVLGLTLANSRIASMEEIRRIKEYLSLILISFLFILLTATLTLADIEQIGWRDGLFILALVFVIRPLVVMLTTKGTKLTVKERALISFVAPRGVVLVAICGLFGPLLVEAGYADGARLVPLSFAVVLSTVLFYGFSIKKLAKSLNLTAKKSGGVLLVGANHWTFKLALALKKQNIPVMIADDNWHRLRQARLAEVPVHYGEVASEGIEHTLEFNPYSYLVAATDNFAYNALVCGKFTHMFGRGGTIQLAGDKDDTSDPKAYSHTLRGKTLVGDNSNYEDIMLKHREGWDFSGILLTEEFSYVEFKRRNGDHTLPVMAISPNGRVTFNIQGAEFSPPEGHTLLVFSPKKDQHAATMTKSNKVRLKDI